LEYGASVGFIHKESVMMHGHTIVKKHTFALHIEVTRKIKTDLMSKTSGRERKTFLWLGHEGP